MTRKEAGQDSQDSPTQASDATSRALYEAWIAMAHPHDRANIAGQMRVPGDVALRGRFHLLADLAPATQSARDFNIEWGLWSRQVELTRQLDDALVRNDREAVNLSAAQLIESAQPQHHPLPRIDALVGRGDAARQADDLEVAIKNLSAAATEAGDCGYRFGEARALVSLGYVTMMIRPMQDAIAAFTRAEGICRALDERMYLANALIGKGEALGRIRNNEEAIQALEEGLDLSYGISSNGGAMNASQHLGEIYRRQKNPQAALPHFTRALELAERTATKIAIVNAADGLGEVSLAADDVNQAEMYYNRALTVADEMSYQRGRAHARNGLGRAALRRSDYQAAIDAHIEAYESFRDLGDLASATSALDGMARVAVASDDLDLAASCRLAAVDSIEQLRSAQDRNDAQIEYVERFDTVYSNALRASLIAEQSHAFVACFEGLAGRRLAGLVSSLPAELAGNAHLVSELTLRAHRSRPDGAKPRAQRLSHLLGSSALRGVLPELAEDAIDDLTAALYRPFDPSAGSALLSSVSECTDVLLVCQIPDDPTVIAWLRTTNNGTHITLGSHGLSEQTAGLVNELAKQGLSANAYAADVHDLLDLLPPVALSHPCRGGLTIVPLGPLWAVPWPAVPTGSGALGARTALAISPSLSLADHAKDSGPQSVRSVGYWRSPLIRQHQLQALGPTDERVTTEILPTAVSTLQALIKARHDALIIAGHGKPLPGIGHFLELDKGVALEPTALLAATPPRTLILLACWGANQPGHERGDPLTLATLALARGTKHVAATTSELRDDRLASRFINNVVHQLPSLTLPEAIRAETERLLTNERARSGPLSRWAPLITVGIARSTS